MNKQDLSDRISKKTGLGLKDVRTVIDSTFEEIKTILLENEEIRINGFARFYNKFHKEKQGRNPATNQIATIPACYRPIVEISDSIKKLVKETIKVKK
ncbi:MAG: HU family DNA-binding protein [Cytophagales bacterium]|jgi:integration host factor subunit alpha|nr:HU family DNA-binding protein [Cytophagales bacterium]